VNPQHRWPVIVAVCALTSAAVSADTLVLRDGRRVQGEVIAMRNGTIEFDVQRGLFGRDRVRVERDEVLRIEFDDRAQPGSDFGSGGRGNSGGNDSGANGPGGSRPPSGMREHDVSVSARERWTDTGLSVRAGQTVYFQASGRVRWGPDRQDGPEGERNSPRNNARPIPNRPAAALIGRVGENDAPFFIGDESGPIRLRGGGRLYLSINDDALQDNSGSFRVTIHY
jgi:hypothetical protein